MNYFNKLKCSIAVFKLGDTRPGLQTISINSAAVSQNSVHKSAIIVIKATETIIVDTKPFDRWG